MFERIRWNRGFFFILNYSGFLFGFFDWFIIYFSKVWYVMALIVLNFMLRCRVIRLILCIFFLRVFV